MDLCSDENQTIVTIKTSVKYIYNVENGRYITGLLGECIDYLFCKHTLRKFKIIDTLHFGDNKLPNGSYTGALALLQQNKADLYLKPETEFMNEEPWLGKSTPLRTEKILLGHLIDDRSLNSNYFDLLQNFDLDFKIYILYFLTLLLSFSFVLIIITFSNYLNKNKELTNSESNKITVTSIKYFIQNFEDTNHRCSPIGLFFIFFSIYIWHVQFFLSNNIRTNKVVIDVSDVLKDRQDVLNTKKTGCIMNNQTGIKLALTSSKDSFLYKIFQKKTKLPKSEIEVRKFLENDRCILRRGQGVGSLIDNKRLFFIGSETSASYLFTLLSQLQIKMKIWLLDHNIYDFNVVLFYRKSEINQKKRKLFNKYLEGGISNFMFRCIEFNSKKNLLRNIKLYTSISELVEESSSSSDLALKNFETLFLVYFSSTSFYLFLFILSKLINRF